MAAEASEPELSGIGAAKNTSRADPSQTDGRAARCMRVGDAPRPARAKHRLLPRQTFSFISSPAAAHAPAEAAYLARPPPSCAKQPYPDYPYIKVCKPEE
jgi:hypothetical protein